MNSTDLQLSYPEFSASSLFGIGNNSSNIIPSFMFENLNGNATTRAIDFMENGGGGSQFMGGYTAAEMGGVNVMGGGQNYHGGSNLCSPFGGMTLDSINNNPFMERGLIAYNQEGNDDHTISSLDVKPKLLALEWQDQTVATTSGGGGGGGYLTGLGSSWGGLMNGYGPSTTNSLV